MPDLAGQITAGMAQLQSARAVTLVDGCTVTRAAEVGQTPALDGDGNITAPADTVVYSGPCSYALPKQAPLRRMTTNDEGGDPEQRQLRLPIGSPDLRAGDVVTCTAAAFSPGLIGDQAVIDREDERTFATYRAYILRGSSWQEPSP